MTLISSATTWRCSNTSIDMVEIMMSLRSVCNCHCWHENHFILCPCSVHVANSEPQYQKVTNIALGYVGDGTP